MSMLLLGEARVLSCWGPCWEQDKRPPNCATERWGAGICLLSSMPHWLRDAPGHETAIIPTVPCNVD